MNLRKLTVALLGLQGEFAPWFGRGSIFLVAVVCLISCGGGSETSVVQGGGPTSIANLCPNAFTLDSTTAAPAAAGLVEPTPTPPQACTNKSECTALSECKPDANKAVTIGSGSGQCGASTSGKVYVDKSFVGADGFGTITIAKDGKLAFLNQSTELDTAGIVVGGLLSVGTFQCRIAHSDLITIKFTGKRPCESPDTCSGFSKGIEVLPEGNLRMVGAKGVPDPRAGAKTPPGVSWTYINTPAGPGATLPGSRMEDPIQTLFLADDVTGDWQNQDWIAVATTSFSPFETEFVKILNVRKAASGAPGGAKSIVDLVQPLKFFHFGSLPPTPSQMCKVGSVVKAVACGSVSGCSSPCTSAPSALNYNDPPARNYGVDERAEIGLISRSIKLTGDIPDGDLNSAHWGGEIRILASMDAAPKRTGEVVIQGVELEKFGKDQRGSYPIHFHMDGDVKNQPLIDANSVHHSFNKCITTHSTQNISYDNNVCARITGHIFYEEVGDESNVTFTGNLGMGAMSNSFDVNETADSTRADLINKYYWPGDNLAKTISFDQFRIFDTDDQFEQEFADGVPRVRGSCGAFNLNGKFELTRPFESGHETCDPKKGDVYFEPPTGFWIINPSAKLKNNSIAGCQDVGKAYWYVPTRDPSATAAKFIPIGARNASSDASKYGLFENNRGHGCYSGLYGEDDGLVTSDQLFGYQGATHDGEHQPVADEFDQVALSRIRDRGVWLRPAFFYVNNARVATSRDGVSLVTSGGVDGNYPGVFGLLQNSVVAGMTSNNVDRWGPCGKKVDVRGIGQVRGAEWGCIDLTKPKSGTATGGEFLDRGYPSPDWPMFGFMIYDGPPLIIHDRFVNFRVAPGSTAPTNFTAANLLTKNDDDILKTWVFNGIPGCPSNPPAYTKYEGDAALGWFNVNPSSYPAATTTKELTFTNVDLRHQIYTEQVNRGGFTDGDENTTILDLDGTLSGVAAMDSSKRVLPSISLNNLGVNASSNSVDECLSKGAEDDALEGRPTSAMVPSAIGQLEFEMLYPLAPQPATNRLNFLAHRQLLKFTKNTIDFDKVAGVEHHQSMPLQSRNGLGDWEPKLTNAYGYTVRASTYPLATEQCKPVPPENEPGISKTVDLTVTDIVNAHVIDSTHPFYVQLGICYTDPDGKHPDPANAKGNLFDIVKGYRSYGGGNVISNSQLKPYWGGALACDGLDNQLAVKNGDPPTNTMTMPEQCPSASSSGSPVTMLTKADRYTDLTADGKPNGTPNLDKYFYDKTNGWLFLWVAQTEANAKGPSPLGNCTGAASDPDFCPGKTTGESYYVCPAQGCPSYRIVLNDEKYTPGASNCGDPYSAAQGYEWPNGPINENTLVIAGTETSVVPKPEAGLNIRGNFPFPHYSTTSELDCPVNP